MEDLVKAMDAADRYLQSWMGWYYRPFMTSHAKGKRCCGLWNEKGSLDNILVGNTSRTYPQVGSRNFAFTAMLFTSSELHRLRKRWWWWW